MLNSKQKEQSIGIFDSGLGGLTVVKEVFKQLKNERVVYFGDTARVPYGTKSKESIIRFSQENANLLLKYNVKLIVVACNSSSSYALPLLQKNLSIPVIGVIISGAKKAVKLTENNRIGVIATRATVQSNQYQKVIEKFKANIKVMSVEAPLFVPLVEEGWINTKVTKAVGEEYLKELKKNKIDTLILGCTHYPLLKNVLSQIMGKNVTLVDSAREVVCEIKDILKQKGLLNEKKLKRKHQFLVSDRPQSFENIAENFLGIKISSLVKVVKV